jgi:hypothetical protein
MLGKGEGGSLRESRLQGEPVRVTAAGKTGLEQKFANELIIH